MNFSSSRVFLTGAIGFLGQHVKTALIEAGKEVGCLVRPGRKGPASKNVSWLESPTETEAIVETVRGFAPDLILHCGGRVLTEHLASDVDDLVQSNLLLTTALCEAGHLCGGLRIVNLGTCLEHGESGRLSPNSLYAATKVAAASIISYYCEQNHAAAITLKAPVIYGPGENRPRLVRLLIDAAISGQAIDLSPGEQELDVLHVRDAVAAVMLAAQKVAKPEAAGRHRICQVTSGQTITPRLLAREIENLSGRKVPANWGARPYKSGERMKHWTGSQQLEGWSPQVDLQTGLAELLESSCLRSDCKQRARRFAL
ncbi:NAD-dependent epimerase/dehydratase family protein [Leisingera sp. ANG-M7]|uniref:NAD-dependent epimerase/dehydratase family protein n=1 Tax=Leisingera sp. ANG-M7 TaxID=1577902 RepID=UPI0005806B8E|nr:NAD(P)-dependent oxidoreductase [Leisingera sp. ANG-M7]KIC35470.1 hypothetical protein RA26_17075 [Leisingera sp. ANG-M7]